MARLIHFIVFAATVVLAISLALAGAQAPAWVIRNARVHTLSSAGTIEHASVVIRDGRIAAVGTSVNVPAGAQVVEGKGFEVYPGMVNAWSDIGLTEIGAVDVMNDANEQGSYKPQLLAFTAVNAASEHIPVARVNGITTSISAPGGGVIAGQAVLLHLDGWTVDEMAIMKSAGMVLNYPTLEGGGRRGFGGFGRPQASFTERKRNYENSSGSSRSGSKRRAIMPRRARRILRPRRTASSRRWSPSSRAAPPSLSARRRRATSGMPSSSRNGRN